MIGLANQRLKSQAPPSSFSGIATSVKADPAASLSIPQRASVTSTDDAPNGTWKRLSQIRIFGSGWELIGADGMPLDWNYQLQERPPYLLHWLLGRPVAGSEVSPPEWFGLRLESGELLCLFDDSGEHESFSIQPGNILV